MIEATACVGDVYVVSEARIQVTGPRYPCVKIGLRWNIPTLTARLTVTGRTDWYCRVTAARWVEPGLSIGLVDRPHPDVTVALVNDSGHRRNRDVAAARYVATCPLLDEWWQRLVVVRAMGKES